MNLFNILKDHADNKPERIAFVCEQSRQSVSYGELYKRCEAYSHHLASKGIANGSKVLILKGMSIELYVALLAIFRLGAVVVFIDPSQPSRFIKACISQTKPDAIFAPQKILLLSWLWPMRWAIKKSLNSNKTDVKNPNGIDQLATPELGTETPALMTFTSGSTGKPKVIVRSHQFLLHQLDALIPHIELESGEHDLCTMPIFILANLATGLTSHLPACDVRNPKNIDPVVIQNQISKNNITRMGASPALLETLLTSSVAPDCLKKIFTGGAPVLPTLMDRLNNWAPNAKIVAVYGSSEAEPISRLVYNDISQDDRQKMNNGNGLLVGQPIADINVKIIGIQLNRPLLNINDNQWQRMQLKSHEVGEIVVCGKHVLSGYLNGEGDADNKIEAEGVRWHRTGDSGYIDGKGRLWLNGRCNAVITDEAGTLYPFSVEVAAASLLPKITLSACVLWQGKRTLLVEGISKQEAAYLLENLKWAKLSLIKSVEKLPVDKRHNAKIDYPALHKILADMQISEN